MKQENDGSKREQDRKAMFFLYKMALTASTEARNNCRRTTTTQSNTIQLKRSSIRYITH